MIGKIIHGSLYKRSRTIQEVGSETIMGSSLYGVVVIDGSLYSQFYDSTEGDLMFPARLEPDHTPTCIL